MSTPPAWTGPRTLLELWQPAGGTVVRPPAGARVEDALVHAAGALAADGVLCVVVPRRLRRRAARGLVRAGLVPRGDVVLVPHGAPSRHAISLAPEAVRDAGPRSLGLHPASASAAAVLLGTRAGRAAARVATPGLALLATRPGAPAPLGWLAELGGGGGACDAAATIGTRTDARVAVVLRHRPGGAGPDLVVKVPLDAAGAERVAREDVALRTLGDAARRAGAGVPAVRGGGGRLVLEALPGVPASAVLARHPARAAAVLQQVAAWLDRWVALTRHRAVASPGQLDALLLAPLDRVRGAYGNSLDAYASALGALGRRLAGAPIGLVAAHGDLTMANVLVGGAGGIGVVDWEAASAAAPPPQDLWYAMADGVARARGCSHAEAVTTLVRGGARMPRGGGALLATAERAGSRDEALLAFHGGWLQHAADELDRGAPGPFCAVVQDVAVRRLRWPA